MVFTRFSRYTLHRLTHSLMDRPESKIPQHNFSMEADTSKGLTDIGWVLNKTVIASKTVRSRLVNSFN